MQASQADAGDPLRLLSSDVVADPKSLHRLSNNTAASIGESSRDVDDCASLSGILLPRYGGKRAPAHILYPQTVGSGTRIAGDVQEDEENVGSSEGDEESSSADDSDEEDKVNTDRDRIYSSRQGAARKAVSGKATWMSKGYRRGAVLVNDDQHGNVSNEEDDEVDNQSTRLQQSVVSKSVGRVRVQGKGVRLNAQSASDTSTLPYKTTNGLSYRTGGKGVPVISGDVVSDTDSETRIRRLQENESSDSDYDIDNTEENDYEDDISRRVTKFPENFGDNQQVYNPLKPPSLGKSLYPHSTTSENGDNNNNIKKKKNSEDEEDEDNDDEQEDEDDDEEDDGDGSEEDLVRKALFQPADSLVESNNFALNSTMSNMPSNAPPSRMSQETVLNSELGEYDHSSSQAGIYEDDLDDTYDDSDQDSIEEDGNGEEEEDTIPAIPHRAIEIDELQEEEEESENDRHFELDEICQDELHANELAPLFGDYSNGGSGIEHELRFNHEQDNEHNETNEQLYGTNDVDHTIDNNDDNSGNEIGILMTDAIDTRVGRHFTLSGNNVSNILTIEKQKAALPLRLDHVMGMTPPSLSLLDSASLYYSTSQPPLSSVSSSYSGTETLSMLSPSSSSSPFTSMPLFGMTNGTIRTEINSSHPSEEVVNHQLNSKVDQSVQGVKRKENAEESQSTAAIERKRTRQ